MAGLPILPSTIYPLSSQFQCNTVTTGTLNISKEQGKSINLNGRYFGNDSTPD